MSLELMSSNYSLSILVDGSTPFIRFVEARKTEQNFMKINKTKFTAENGFQSFQIKFAKLNELAAPHKPIANVICPI